MDRLTPRQDEVMHLMARGLTNGQIAERMGVTLAGAKWHVSEVLSKLGVASREEAVALWRAENGAGSRLRALTGLLFGTKAVVAGAAVAGVAGVFVAATLVLGGASGGEPERFVAGDGKELVADGQGRYVYAGNCESWTGTMNGIPLCGPMADDEVRFAIDFVAARVRVEGLAGDDYDQVVLELADGSTVELPRMSGYLTAENPEADGGGFFRIEGAYASPPARLTLRSVDGATAKTVLLGAAADERRWPTVAAAITPGPATFSQSIDGACVLWQFADRTKGACADDEGIVMARGGGSLNGGSYLTGLTEAETDRIVAGFDDGTLADAYVERGTTPGGTPFLAYGVLADRGRDTLTLTYLDAADKVIRVEDVYNVNDLPEPSGSIAVTDRLSFADGELLVGADWQGCMRFEHPDGDAQGGHACPNRNEIRRLEDHLILTTSVMTTPIDRVGTYLVLNPDVDMVEVVDEAGNVYRERAQTIPSSPQGLKFVYFDREVAAPAMDLRVLDAAGEVLETQEGTLAVGR